MSTWFELLNQLKRRCSAEMLTPAQATAFNELCRLMLMPEWLNLSGPHGSGKTFLAWALSRATGGLYVPMPEDLDELPPQHTLIVDNAPYSEAEVRRILSRCELLGAKTVLLVTCEPVQLPMPTVSLPAPSSEEIERIGQVFTRLGFPVKSESLPEGPTLWDLMLAAV